MTGYQVCVVTGAFILIGMALLHLLLIMGFPLGELVLGGQSKVIPRRRRYIHGIFVLVFAAVALLYLEKAGMPALALPVTFLNVTIALFLFFLIGATVFNFAITKTGKRSGSWGL